MIFGWRERLDPYWGYVWSTSLAAWSSRVSVEKYVEGGYMAPPRWLSRTQDECLDAIASGPRSGRRRAAMSAVNMFRVMSAEQLACIMGDEVWAAPRSEDRGVLYGTGLVEVGQIVSILPNTLPELLRTKVASKPDVLRDRLTWEQMSLLTSGGHWSSAMATDRHGFLATELLLRVAEVSDSPLIFGEAMARLSMLTPTVSPLSLRAADGVVVRDDGMVVAVELVTSLSGSLHTKLELWCDIVAHDPNVRVVFVVASHPSGWSATKELKKRLWRAVSGTGMSMPRVQERVFFAEWKDWFPELGVIDPSFRRLRAARPTGPKGERWQPVNILSRDDIVYRGDAKVLESPRYLTGIPHWQRQ